MTKEELIQFSEEIKDLFLAGRIRTPIHLSGGNEAQLIEIFKDISKDDWVFSTYRSHYHALLKGIPSEQLKQAILDGHSMHINSHEHRFFTSSIVGGCLPIALGAAIAIKRQDLREKVWVFVGDMAAEMGIFHECWKYSRRMALPIQFIVEDNGLSVNTPTQEAWGGGYMVGTPPRYTYERIYPHQGVGQWVEFK